MVGVCTRSCQSHRAARTSSIRRTGRVHDILVRIIETTTDDAQRETARELLLTLPVARH
jgi:hypothetical protein